MPDISEPLVTQLDAFRADGLHCGWARLQSDGTWNVHATSASYGAYAHNREQAENFLRSHGATRIIPSDGRK